MSSPSLLLLQVQLTSGRDESVTRLPICLHFSTLLAFHQSIYDANYSSLQQVTATPTELEVAFIPYLVQVNIVQDGPNHRRGDQIETFRTLTRPQTDVIYRPLNIGKWFDC